MREQRNFINRQIKSTIRTTGKEAHAHNKVLPQAGLKCSYETFVLNRTLVFQINSSAEAPRLRQYPNRYSQCLDGQANRTFGCPTARATASQPKELKFPTHDIVNNFLWTLFVQKKSIIIFGQNMTKWRL